MYDETQSLYSTCNHLCTRVLYNTYLCIDGLIITSSHVTLLSILIAYVHAYVRIYVLMVI